MARKRIKKYILESNSLELKHKEIKQSNKVIIYANTFNPFNPKIIRV